MSELFSEIDEEVRREQLKKLWDKYSLLIIAVVILIVAGVGGWRAYEYFQTQKAAEMGAAFDRAIELSEQGKHTEAETAFADLVAKAPAGYRALARLRLAAEIANRDRQAAARMYDEIADDRSVGAAEQDLARIRGAQLLLESETYQNMLQRLQPATAENATFRHTARELLALSAYRANDTAAARQWLDLIANDAETPPSMRSRAEALQALLPPVAKS